MADGTSIVFNELAPLVLLAGFFLLVGAAVAMVAFVCRQSRLRLRGPGAGQAILDSPPWSSDRSVWQPFFDGSFRWLAVRCQDSVEVQTALRLRNPRLCSWEEGLHRAMDHRLFISPPMNGWILVMGADLPDPSEDADACFHLISRLSRVLGEVQFFSINRMFNHHAWALADAGRVRRGYAWAGQTVWNQGVPTQVELALRLPTYDYCELPQRAFLSYSDPLGTATEKVTALAARWSVDPTTVDFRRLRGNPGISGKFSFRSSPH
ncbi:MAG: hypothetical protein FJ405_16575 [Verrucomicrobia bacterium]|nr:hypothetical protein [Verrucomicrobiota bacterium]